MPLCCLAKSHCVLVNTAMENHRFSVLSPVCTNLSHLLPWVIFLCVIWLSLSFSLEQLAVFLHSLSQQLLSRHCLEISSLQPRYMNKHPRSSDQSQCSPHSAARASSEWGQCTRWDVGVVRAENYAIFIIHPRQQDKKNRGFSLTINQVLLCILIFKSLLSYVVTVPLFSEKKWSQQLNKTCISM